MKRIIGFVLLTFCLFSCKNNNSQTVNNNVQHDTLKTEAANNKKDSIISNGEYIQYYKNGVIKIRGIMKDGKREGLWKSFYENGSPWSETTFKAGKKNGRTTTWYENEKKRYDGFYTDDIESGRWTSWDEKGNLISDKTY